jgi:hypothetical protein
VRADASSQVHMTPRSRTATDDRRARRLIAARRPCSRSSGRRWHRVVRADLGRRWRGRWRAPRRALVLLGASSARANIPTTMVRRVQRQEAAVPRASGPPPAASHAPWNGHGRAVHPVLSLMAASHLARALARDGEIAWLLSFGLTHHGSSSRSRPSTAPAVAEGPPISTVASGARTFVITRSRGDHGRPARRCASPSRVWVGMALLRCPTARYRQDMDPTRADAASDGRTRWMVIHSMSPGRRRHLPEPYRELASVHRRAGRAVSGAAGARGRDRTLGSLSGGAPDHLRSGWGPRRQQDHAFPRPADASLSEQGRADARRPRDFDHEVAHHLGISDARCASSASTSR